MNEETLGQRLARLRTAAKLSQRKLAELADVPQATISKIESGAQTSTALATLVSLATALGVPAAELIGEAAPAPAAAAAAPPAGTDPGLRLLALAQLRPSSLNPRKTFDDEGIRELADSIAAQGLLQNLVVREVPFDGGGYVTASAPLYDVIAGGRRYRALHLLASEGKWDADALAVPCRLLDVDDAQHLALALLENLQRKDVNAMEEAEAFAQLQSLDPERWTTKTISEQIGCSMRHIQQRLALVGRLSPAAQDALRDGKINFTQARILTMAPAEHQAQFVMSIKAGSYSSADSLRNAVTSDMIPVSRAIFDIKSYPGQIVEHPDTGAKYFADKATFLTAQRKAVAALIETLQAEWSWVEERGWFSGHGYGLKEERSTDRTEAGCIVVVSDYDGTVKVHEGLVRTQQESDEEKKARHVAEAAVNEAKQQAQDAFKRQLVSRMGEEPGTMMRLFLLDRMTEGYNRILSHGYYSGGLHKTFFDGGPLSPLAGFIDRARGDGSQYLKNDDVMSAAWAALERLPDDVIADAWAASLAVNMSLSWTNLHPALLALSRRWQIAIPAHLQPEQGDIEDAANAVRAYEQPDEDLSEDAPDAPASAPTRRVTVPKMYMLRVCLEMLDKHVEMAVSDFREAVGDIADWVLASGYVRELPPEDPDVDVPGVALSEAGEDWLVEYPRGKYSVSNPLMNEPAKSASVPAPGEAAA